MTLAALFWVSALVLLYVYAGYPALCWLRARLRPRPYKADPAFKPFVSVLIAAYNEENDIGQRIANVAAQETDCRVEVLVGSDGSTDATVERARQAADEARERGVEVRVFELPRCGKMATMASVAQEARGDVLVFTDANSEFARGALSAVVTPLADPSVACASGSLCINSGHEHTVQGEKSYWGFETKLKAWESSFGSSAGADGALYAIRLLDFPPPITKRLVADDFYVSLAVCTRQRRCVVAPGAVVLEASDTSGRNELRRKARILAGALAAVAQNRRLLLPGSGLCLTLWSHKVLRWFSFVPICGMLIGAAGLPSPAAQLFYMAAAAAAAGVAIGALFPSSMRAAPVKISYYFALMNFGQMLGLLEWVRNGNQPAWEKLR